MRCSRFVVFHGVLLVAVMPPADAASQARGDRIGIRGEWTAVEGEMHGEPIPSGSLPLLRLIFDGTEGRWTVPAFPQRFRYETFADDPAPDSLDLHMPVEAPRSWIIPVRLELRADTLRVALRLGGPFDPANAAPPRRPDLADLDRSGPFVRLTLVRSDAPPRTSSLSDEESSVATEVDAAAIERGTRALVAPDLEGRESGQPGGEEAALLIAEWFAGAGLEPLGHDGYLQRVPFFSGRAAPGSFITIGDTTFHMGSGVSLTGLAMRTRPAMEVDVTGEVVLFGPSLGHAPAGEPLPALDVEGKVVAWSVVSGPADGSSADVFRTYEALHRSGAAAIIALAPGPLPEPVLRSPVFSGVHALDADLHGPRAGRPMLLLAPQAFGAMFGDGSEVREFFSAPGASGPTVRPTGQEVRIAYQIEETTAAPTHNVVGLIRGSDPSLRHEAVVYTAHYDAFGIHDGVPFPGAADNALGVAELVEIARAMTRSGVRPRRSMVFLAVGAEERGLLGTLHWMRHPTWPLGRIVANINMDGGDAEAWGPLHGVIDITRHATLADDAADIAAAMGLPLLPNDGPGGPGGSDYYEFLRAGIPAIQLMGIGGDPALSLMRMGRWSQRAHQPGDVIDEGWNWAGPRQMAQLYLLLGLRVANTDEPPRLRSSSPYSR